MNRENNLVHLANIIKDYRKGELDFTPDVDHIRKWLSQFSPESQDVILQETLHVFQEWYFSNEYVDEKVDRIPNYLQKKYHYSTIHSVCNSVSFLSVQKDGNSQRAIISRLAERMCDRYGISIKTEIDEDINHYVYFDDGLYTGSRARKDLEEIICYLPKNSTLEVFYIVACESAFLYTKKIVSEQANQRGITLLMHSWKTLFDVKSSEWSGDGTESWCTRHDCLWPMPSLKADDDVRAYIGLLTGISDAAKNYLFRKANWANDAGIFTTVENRAVVEKEFLLQGIKILESVSERKGIYPLGYNSFLSLGLGSFCAFEMNISNTCPLVLWWGNNTNKGDILDAWYPLLPRRVNPREKAKNHWDDMVFWGERNSMDQYNMCPDCGGYFGLEEDGGNGFCIDCAWKH